MGMAFGSPGNNFREVLEPVDHTIHDLRFGQSLASDRIRLNLAYHLSLFENEATSVVADNPLTAADHPAQGSSRGRVGLAPSSVAQGFTAAASASLPRRTRLNGTVSYSWRRQDEPFLPYTINTAIDASAQPISPRGLDGQVRTTLVSVSGSIQPVRQLSITGRYRTFDFADHTPRVVLPVRVLSDRVLATGEFVPQRYPHRRHNAGLDGRWRLGAPLTLRAGYDWERWERSRDVRDVGTTNEHIPRLALDLILHDRIHARGSFEHSNRRGDGYAIHPADTELATLRRFDLADRDRRRVRASIDLLPWDAVDIALSYELGRRRYPDSLHGLQAEGERSVTVDLGWTLGTGLNVHATYARESFDARQQSRYRAPPAQLENESFDWVGITDERVRTIGAGATARLIPGKLDLTASLARSRGHVQMLAFNPTPPSGGTSEQHASATAADLPEIGHTLTPVEGTLRYRLSETWVTALRFTQDGFRRNDFRVDGLTPATGSDLFLGDGLSSYSARLFTLTVEYRPWMLGARTPPLQ
jgi:MtrB/PioB family decaheme-associated outer membrane protein